VITKILFKVDNSWIIFSMLSYSNNDLNSPSLPNSKSILFLVRSKNSFLYLSTQNTSDNDKETKVEFLIAISIDLLIAFFASGVSHK